MKTKQPKYRQILNDLRVSIQKGEYPVGSELPSENELCRHYSVTRTTARKTLEELRAEGFIERYHGRKSVVRERRDSLGLLNVKGFSEAVGQNVKTTVLKKPAYAEWNHSFPFQVTEQEQKSSCIYFERLRSVRNHKVMIERNWFASSIVPDFLERPFVENSFFKTLSYHYQIEIIGSEQEIGAVNADQSVCTLLKIEEGSPVLLISIRFSTNQPGFFIYSELICNTKYFPIGNSYFI